MSAKGNDEVAEQHYRKAFTLEQRNGYLLSATSSASRPMAFL